MFGLYQILLNTKKGTCKLQTGKETNRQVFTKKKGENQNWVVLKDIRDKLKTIKIDTWKDHNL